MVDHFYTTDPKGEDALKTNYEYLGVLCYVFDRQVKGTVPVYRSYNENKDDHFYTTSRAEHNHAVQKLGYKAHQIGWFMFDKKPTDTIEVITLDRYYDAKTSDHLYITDEELARENCDISEYTKETVAGYVLNDNAYAPDGTRAVPLYCRVLQKMGLKRRIDDR
ncbi:hypothetical protein K440DRAFT_661609 [Wilcoxina mikolae CBS 423.85]|nr:hypothetical protein K440DRAFT_661609 [Wilcoxina mikolae CBS 423.85]